MASAFLKSVVNRLAIFLLLFELISCKSGEAAYSYQIVQNVGQPDNSNRESAPSFFVSFKGNIFEYEVATVEQVNVDVKGKEGNGFKAYDTLGLYLLKPEEGKYQKLISFKTGQDKSADSGSLDQKNFGISFAGYKSKTKEVANQFSSRDTMIDGVALRCYEREEIDSALNDTRVIRYYFFKNSPINSILSYVTAKYFENEKNIFRFELFSKKGLYSYLITVNKIAKLSENETSQFKKLIGK